MGSSLRPSCILAVLVLVSACGSNGATGGAGGSGGHGGTQEPPQPPDRSNISFVDNLLVKVADGEWTLGEGLVATLKLFAGELDETSVLRHPELLVREGTGVIAMSYEYLEDGPDDDAKAEITRLLDLVVFSTERLEAMAGLVPATRTANSTQVGRTRKDAEGDCKKFFSGWTIPPGVGQCLEVRSSVVLEDFYPGDYRIFGPAPPLPTAGWTDQHYDLALEALDESVPVFKNRGELPAISIVLSAQNSPVADASAAFDSSLPGEARRPCGIALHPSMQGGKDGVFKPGNFKQIVAHEVAHCYQGETFREQNEAGVAITKWREEGMAEYLSNVVYPDNNLEWTLIPTLEKFELATTVIERAYTNFLFFQYLGNRLGDAGLDALIKTLPTSGGTDEQTTRLAQYPGMDGIYHDFAKATTDEQIEDSGKGFVAYGMSQTNRPTVTVTDPHIIMEDNLRPFGISRYHLGFEGVKEALVAFHPDGQVRESARTLNDFDWGDIPDKVPHECSELFMVVTTTKAKTGYELDVPEVRDAPGLCLLEGEWLVDNDSLEFDPLAFELDDFHGEMRITFRDDGSAEVVYDGWGYRVFADETLNVIGPVTVIERHEEFTHTTDATGVTTYEVDGDRIDFGHLQELSFLNGTETVHHIRTFDPPNTIGADIDEVRLRPATGWGLFEAFPEYDLQGDTLRFLGSRGADLHRVGSAEE